MKILRWIAVIPAGLAGAVLVTFPIHWLILLAATSEDNLFIGLLSAETVERLAIAFTTPFFIIYAGAWTAPTHRSETGIALAITTALILGGFYVIAFTGGPMFRGWSSLHFGATPVLNLVGLATAIYAVRKKWNA